VALRVRSIAAAIATFHDIFAIVGIFWILGIEKDLLFITALLTIGGYSLTDTVVVFDRIRENIRLRKKGTFSDTINLSVNEVLSRTIVTSMTVFIATISLLVFGGSCSATRAGSRWGSSSGRTPRFSWPARSLHSGAARK
jgi:preprotein translocase SecF subunit